MFAAHDSGVYVLHRTGSAGLIPKLMWYARACAAGSCAYVSLATELPDLSDRDSAIESE